MEKATKILARLSISDIVISKEDSENMPGYIDILDKNGKKLTEVEVYSIGYEDAEGNECKEDGTYFDQTIKLN